MGLGSHLRSFIMSREREYAYTSRLRCECLLQYQARRTTLIERGVCPENCCATTMCCELRGDLETLDSLAAYVANPVMARGLGSTPEYSSYLARRRNQMVALEAFGSALCRKYLVEA